MEKSATKVYIVDDELKSNHPIIVKLGQAFAEVKLFKKASDAIAAIKESKIIRWGEWLQNTRFVTEPVVSNSCHYLDRVR